MALISPAEARAYIRTLTGAAEDGALEVVIARADAALAQHLGYPRRSATAGATLASASYTLYSGSSGLVVDGRALLPSVAPITAITSIYDDPDRGYSSTYLVASSDYDYDAVSGRIWLLPTAVHGGWSTAERAIKLTVTAGWASESVPDDLRLAAVLLVRAWWDRRGHGTDTQLSAGGVSRSPSPRAIPPEIQELVAPYAILHGVAQ